MKFKTVTNVLEGWKGLGLYDRASYMQADAQIYPPSFYLLLFRTKLTDIAVHALQ